MELSTVAAFALAAVVAIAIPGPTVLLALANGTRYGVKRSTYGMLGAVASDIVLVVAVGLGLGALLLASETVFTIVKWIGVAYLVYLGIRMLLSRGALLHGDPTADPRGTRRAVFLRSFLVAVTNPKGYLFVGVFAYALLGSQAVRVLKRRGAVWIERVSGVILLGLAGWLALARRTPAT